MLVLPRTSTSPDKIEPGMGLVIPALGFKQPEPAAGTFVFVGVGPAVAWLVGVWNPGSTRGEVAVGAGMFVGFAGVGVKGIPINSLRFGAMNELIIEIETPIQITIIKLVIERARKFFNDSRSRPKIL